MSKPLSRTATWILVASIAAAITVGAAIYFTVGHIAAVEQEKHQLEKALRTATLVKASFIAGAHTQAMENIHRHRRYHLGLWSEWYAPPRNLAIFGTVATSFDLYARARDFYQEIRHYLDGASRENLDRILAETDPAHEDFLRIYGQFAEESSEPLDYEGLRIGERLAQVDRTLIRHVFHFPDSLKGAIVSNISLWDAIDYGNLEVVKLYLQAGAAVNERVDEGESPPSHLVEWNLDDLLAGTGEKKGPASASLWLADSGLRRDVRSMFRGETPLHAAAWFGHLDVAEVLLAAGADPNATNTGEGRTPLHTAAMFGYADMVKMLLEAGAKVDARGTFNNATPLHRAVLHGHSEAASILLEAGADSNAAADTGITPLHQVVAPDRESDPGEDFPGVEIIEILLAKGADPAVSDDHDWTPLHLASASGHAKEAEALLAAGASPTAKDKDGDTALHIVVLGLDLAALTAGSDEESGVEAGAIRQEFLDIARALLEAGAKVDEKNGSNETPLEVAIRKGHEDLVQLLRTAGGSPGFGG